MFGDPAAYLKVGRNLSGGLERIASGRSAVDVFVSIRGSLYFAGAGAFYGIVDWLRPNDVQAIRWALIGLNAIGFVGVFSLARRLATGSTAAGMFSVGLAILHPSFSTHLGRAYPDPLTGALFVWAAALFVRGAQEGSGQALLGSTFLLSFGLLVRPQILAPVLLVILVLVMLALVLPALRLRILPLSPVPRPAVFAILAGLLPAALLWIALHAAIAMTSDRRGHEDEFAGRYGWTVFRSAYPQGFWQYFETDGWEGPYRLRQEPFYKALEAEAALEPEVLSSSVAGYAFAARYALERPLDSILLMLDNSYRIFDRPTNSYRWDYPLPSGAQLALHRLIVIAALAQLALLSVRAPAHLPIFLIPACLAVIHAFTFPWPRYSQASLLILIAAAGAFASEVVELVLAKERAASRIFITLVHCIGIVMLAGFSPEGARAISLLALTVALLTPFVLIAARETGGRQRLLPLLASLILLIPFAAHQARDGAWHERQIRVGGETPSVSQTLSLGAKAAASLREARQSFVVFDLLVPRGDASGIHIEVNGAANPGSALIPTMPRFSESTTTGGRDPRTYRQWWALPLPAQALAGEGPLTLTIRLSASPGTPMPVLFGDRHREEQTAYRGPSFSEFPRAVALKIEYDGDHRIPARYVLASDRTESRVHGVAGPPEKAAMVFRIRVVSLASNAGHLTFETEAARTPKTAWAFFAYSGSQGEAQIGTARLGPVAFPLGSTEHFDAASEGLSLCYRARGEKAGSPYGGFVLRTDNALPGAAESVRVAFLSGMSVEPRHVHLDLRASEEGLESLFDECAVPAGVDRLKGAARILDATRNSYPDDTGKWTVAAVY